MSLSLEAALTRAPIGVWRSQPETRRLSEQAALEALAVADARNVAVPVDAMNKTFAQQRTPRWRGAELEARGGRGGAEPAWLHHCTVSSMQVYCHRNCAPGGRCTFNCSDYLEPAELLLRRFAILT
ncbi:MAG: hypothetical protein IPK16_02910 [Anaerolineales bacterium]|nr:hypothetical protein [Anaerolineales bacterium]